MTKRLFFPVLILLFFALLSFEEELTPSEAAAAILTGTNWKLQSTKIDGVSSHVDNGLKSPSTTSGYSSVNDRDLFGASVI